MSRFYAGDPDVTVPTERAGRHHWVIRPGDQVVYENPDLRQHDGTCLSGGIDGPLAVTEVVGSGGGMARAILNDSQRECSAGNLRAVTEETQ